MGSESDSDVSISEKLSNQRLSTKPRKLVSDTAETGSEESGKNVSTRTGRKSSSSCSSLETHVKTPTKKMPQAKNDGSDTEDDKPLIKRKASSPPGMQPKRSKQFSTDQHKTRGQEALEGSKSANEDSGATSSEITGRQPRRATVSQSISLNFSSAPMPSQDAMKEYTDGMTDLDKQSYKKLRKELAKLKPNSEAVLTYMKSLYKARKRLYGLDPDVDLFFRTFPPMKCYHQIRLDFIATVLVDWGAFEANVHALMEEAAKKTTKDPLVLQAAAKGSTNRDRSDYERDLGIISLGFKHCCGTLYGNLYKDVEKGEEGWGAYQITTINILQGLESKEMKAVVMLEGVQINQTSSLYEAIMCSYMLHWLFNLNYERHSKPLFELFDSIRSNAE